MKVRSRHADAKQAHRRALASSDHAFGLHQLVEGGAALQVVFPAGLDQGQRARGAHEQPHAEARLEPRNRPADRGRRDCGSRGGGGETAELGG